MSNIGTLLTAVGVMMVVVSVIWIIVVAFQESSAWGAACLLVPVFVLGFQITHWGRVKKPTVVEIVGWLVMFLGATLSGAWYS